jgi:hypothetical protein
MLMPCALTVLFQPTTSSKEILRSGSLTLKEEDGAAVQLDSIKLLRVVTREARPIWEAQANIQILLIIMMACLEIIQATISKTGL